MTRELLSADDARVLALESGTVRGHTCKVLVIAGDRTAQQVRAHLEGRLGAVPRLMQRLDPGPGRPAWDDDPGFSLERHVTSRGTLNDVGLRRHVGAVMATPLDRERPLWAIDVVALLPRGRTALVWRIHHALADGMTAMRMARELLLEATTDEAPGRGPGARERSSRRSAVRRAASMPTTLRRELARHATPSPLARAAGPRRAVAFVDAPLEALRRIGHTAPERATINDVALSAVGGGLRRWLEALDAPSAALRLKVPVSLHARAILTRPIATPSSWSTSRSSTTIRSSAWPPWHARRERWHVQVGVRSC